MTDDERKLAKKVFIFSLIAAILSTILFFKLLIEQHQVIIQILGDIL